ncbi:MAG TPA: dTDP-4-dehydrorhamnose reductase [Cyanobacteria bacterium UBA8530]|nr:dTDP-4-dehydrorhamnose reductase [Cyanobacteria bacterium UBA8530]
MKVFVTGAEGMLGKDAVSTLRSEGHEVFPSDLRMEGPGKLDLTDEKAVQTAINRAQPEIVFHLGAFTDVDKSESRPLDAFRVNALGTQNLALACLELGIPLLYVSTDYVFDGKKDCPYLEYDQTAPLGVYGQSKRAGELHIQQLLSRFFIVRTSWLYGSQGKNFVDTIAKAARERKELTVVNDQFGSPTYTIDLAKALLDIAQSGRYGIYHATGGGETTWFHFAAKILELANIPTPVLPISTEELNRPAPRPRYSVMRNLALELAGLPPLPAWEDALSRYLGIRQP